MTSRATTRSVPCSAVTPLVDDPVPFDLTLVLRSTHFPALVRESSQPVSLLLGPCSLVTTRRRVPGGGVESRDRSGVRWHWRRYHRWARLRRRLRCRRGCGGRRRRRRGGRRRCRSGRRCRMSWLRRRSGLRRCWSGCRYWLRCMRRIVRRCSLGRGVVVGGGWVSCAGGGRVHRGIVRLCGRGHRC